MSVLLDIHLFQDRVPCDLVFFGDRLHQRLNKVLGRLNAEDGQHCSFGLNPERLLIRVRVSDVGKPIGEFKSDRVVSGIGEFVVANGGHTVEFAKNGSEGVITFGSLLYVNKRDLGLVRQTLTKKSRCSESTLWTE